MHDGKQEDKQLEKPEIPLEKNFPLQEAKMWIEMELKSRGCISSGNLTGGQRSICSEYKWLWKYTDGCQQNSIKPV